MAIARTVRPTVIIAGEVERTRELKRKSDQSVYAKEITIRQDAGALASITMYDRPGTPPVPQIGEFIAAECSIEESREFGASLGFERPAFDALDRIATGLKSGGK
ncbi:hypothetical protein [Leucobacter sp.]